MESWFTTSFNEFTLGWLLLSTILGGVVGAVITLVFDEILKPKIAMRREEKRIYKKYQYPLLSAANSLERQINTIVRSRGQAWLVDPYYQLSTYYKFGVYLFWVREIELDDGFLSIGSSSKARTFSRTLYGPFSGLSSIRRYFNDDPDASKTILRRDIARAIGEEMLDDKKSTADKPRPMGFSTFVRRYGSDAQFRIWFTALEDMLEEMAGTPRQIRQDRLIITAAHLKLLIAFLDPKATFTKQRFSNLELIKSEKLKAELRKSGIEVGQVV